MLQLYVIVSGGLFFSYWSGYPSWVFGFFILIHLLVFGASQSPNIPNSLEYAYAAPLSLLVGCGIGGALQWLTRKPQFRFVGTAFVVKALVVAALYCGTLVTWQLAPAKVYTYLLAGSLPQLLLILGSYYFLDHTSSWALHSSDASRIAHWHFIIPWFLLQIPFLAGMLARPDLPTYLWTVAFLGATTVWFGVNSLCILGQKPAKVHTMAMPVKVNPDGSLAEEFWRVSDNSSGIGVTQ